MMQVVSQIRREFTILKGSSTKNFDFDERSRSVSASITMTMTTMTDWKYWREKSTKLGTFASNEGRFDNSTTEFATTANNFRKRYIQPDELWKQKRNLLHDDKLDIWPKLRVYHRRRLI